jgi:hypothetical protein
VGLLSILAGLLLAGVLADYLVENDIATAATQPFVLFGMTWHLSTPVLVAIAFGLGLFAVLLVLAGIRRMRRGRRKTLQQRVSRLEDENARLHTQRNLQRIVRVPEAAPEEPQPAAQQAADEPVAAAEPAAKPEPPVPTRDRPATTPSDEPVSNW